LLHFCLRIPAKNSCFSRFQENFIEISFTVLILNLVIRIFTLVRVSKIQRYYSSVSHFGPLIRQEQIVDHSALSLSSTCYQAYTEFADFRDLSASMVVFDNLVHSNNHY
jgi:hypothetical protein